MNDFMTALASFSQQLDSILAKLESEARK